MTSTTTTTMRTHNDAGAHVRAPGRTTTTTTHHVRAPGRRTTTKHNRTPAPEGLRRPPARDTATFPELERVPAHVDDRRRHLEPRVATTPDDARSRQIDLTPRPVLILGSHDDASGRVRSARPDLDPSRPTVARPDASSSDHARSTSCDVPSTSDRSDVARASDTRLVHGSSRRKGFRALADADRPNVSERPARTTRTRHERTTRPDAPSTRPDRENASGRDLARRRTRLEARRTTTTTTTHDERRG